MPDDLVGGDASALKTQTKLKTISLTTDGTCGSNIETQFFVDLVPFKELHTLSWRGISTFGDFEAVKKCIAAHRDTLTSLTLDLISWERATATWRKTLAWQSPMPTTTHQNFFASNVLGVQVGQAIERLPSLDHLSLSAVSFRSVPMEMACALNFAGLRELELWHCPYSLRLLGALVEFASNSMTLKSFKFTIASDPGSPPGSCEAIVARFLKCFQGLEELHLMLPSPIDWAVLCGGAMRHSSTLQHFVAHTRSEAYLNTRFEAPSSDDDLDRNIPWTDDIARLLRAQNLVGIGLGILPSVLVSNSLRDPGAGNGEAGMLTVLLAGELEDGLLQAHKLRSPAHPSVREMGGQGGGAQWFPRRRGRTSPQVGPPGFRPARGLGLRRGGPAGAADTCLGRFQLRPALRGRPARPVPA